MVVGVSAPPLRGLDEYKSRLRDCNADNGDGYVAVVGEFLGSGVV